MVSSWRRGEVGHHLKGEVTKVHACTLLSGRDVWRANAQGLTYFQRHLDEATLQRVRELLDQRQTFTIPERCHVGYP